MLKTPQTLLDHLIGELADVLGPAEEAAIGSDNRPEFPVVFVVGNSRCGSTLMMQWLAATGAFCYPTNLLARFYASPYLGAKIQQLLADPRYQHLEEFQDLGKDGAFASATGKTKGLLAPHEFWHFWRRFLPTYYLEPIQREQEHLVDARGLSNGLAAIQKVFGKPLALKGKMFNFNIRLLHGICPRAVFLHLKRDPAMVAQSIYLARQTNPANSDWFGVRPPEYAELRRGDIFHQIAGQVLLTDLHLEKQLSALSDGLVLEVDYANFCDDPATLYGRLVSQMDALGCVLPGAYAGPKKFTQSDAVRIPPQEFEKLRRALDEQPSALAR
jgi:LPS sulfotransferase NodH